jgi:hypothetical protein
MIKKDILEPGIGGEGSINFFLTQSAIRVIFLMRS